MHQDKNHSNENLSRNLDDEANAKIYTVGAYFVHLKPCKFLSLGQREPP
jgi:hypothetical protein